MQELSMNILDIAQNSVKADATRIEISVLEDPSADSMLVEIADNGCGMDAETVRRVTDPFYTTRTTRRVGLGLPFFKMAAELTNGDLRVESQPGQGTRVTARFGLTHIDRAPLGDMAQTMCALIGCNPELDFSYTHAVGNESYTADTAEFRQVLEGVPLSEPEVLAFLAEYIKEHDQNLYGGAT